MGIDIAIYIDFCVTFSIISIIILQNTLYLALILTKINPATSITLAFIAKI